ncbi:MAG TPA: hypothetical protein VFY14_08355, partial [Streptomyces sp.]|nr:hypothetical protein [Streptomyces sp.]
MSTERRLHSRDHRLAAARARLRSIKATGDLALAVVPEALAETRGLRELLDDDGEDAEAAYRLGWLTLFRELALPPDDHRRNSVLGTLVEMFVPCLLSGVGDLPPHLLPHIGDAAEPAVIALLERTLVSSAPALLDTVVHQYTYVLKATPADHPGLPQRLSNLGTALHVRYERRSSGPDLDAAIDAHRAAVEATRADDLDLVIRLNGLAGALHTRFEQHADLADLDAAIAAMNRAVEVLPAGHSHLAMVLSNLGRALRTRFERTADVEDLDAAIAVGRQALEVTATDDPRRGHRLQNLSGTLMSRYLRDQGAADLEAAVAALREAVGATPQGHPDRWVMLSSLGYALIIRAVRTEDTADLDAAVLAQQAAAEAAPAGHSGRWLVLSNLGVALRSRCLSSPTAGGEAAGSWGTVISTFRAAVETIPPGHTQRAKCLANLAGALRDRSARANGPVADLDEAVAVAGEAVASTPSHHLELGHRLGELGRILWTRSERTGGQADREEAVRAYTRAAATESTAPFLRVSAAGAGARLLAGVGDMRSADLLGTAVELLPSVAPRRLERRDQQYTIGGFAGLAADAAALTLARQGGEEGALRALQLLETGRGVLLSQALETRSDLTELREKAPGLAARFVTLREELDRSPLDSSLAPGIGDAGLGGEPSQEQRETTVRDFAAVLGEIRSLGGGLASF